MLLLTTGVFETLRFIPPLNVSEAEINEALTKFDKSVASAVKDGF
jgi:4-aminobutyrate aminotransferase